MTDFSPTQLMVLRLVLRRELNRGCEVQIAGHRQAPLLSACRALVRKGFMHSWRTGHFGLTEEGRPHAVKALYEHRKALGL